MIFSVACLAFLFSTGSRAADRYTAGLGPCTADASAFTFKGNSSETSAIQTFTGISACLDIHIHELSNQIVFGDCSGSPAQTFSTTAAPGKVTDGVLVRSSAPQPCKKPGREGSCRMCLDVYGGAGKSVDAFDCKESGDGQVENQLWIVKPVSSTSVRDGAPDKVQFVWVQDTTKCMVAHALPPAPSPPPTPPPRGQPLPFDPRGHLGRVYDGIGGLSNSDAMLLRDYPEQQRSDILDLLFKPGSLAQMSFLKVEIGGDGSSTVSTESSWKHSADDSGPFNPERGWENWLIQEAKARNPDITLYGLAWAAPGWLANASVPAIDGGAQFSREQYYSYDTADYLTGWALGIWKELGYLVEYLGIRNESGNPPNWFIKLLRRKLDAAGMAAVQIVVADQHDFTIATQLLQDQEAMDAVGVLGVHEPLRDAESVPADALATGKKMWGSESYTTYSDNNGGGCWARENSWCYVYGQVTANIAWNLIQTYPWGLAYDGHGLMWAVEPWSGHYLVNPPIFATAHYSQFAWPCWRYLENGFGSGLLPGGGSYVGYVPGDGCTMAGEGEGGSAMRPRAWDFSIVAQTMEHNNSACFKDNHPDFSVDPLQQVTFQLSADVVGGLPEDTQLHLWHSHFAPGDDVYRPTESTFFEYAGPVNVTAGPDGSASVNVSMRSNSIYTLSTIRGGRDFKTAPPSGSFPTSYSDPMSVAKEGQRAAFTLDSCGVFEGYQLPGDDRPRITQVVPERPMSWQGDLWHPTTLVGGVNRTSVTVKVATRPADAALGDKQAGFGGIGVLQKHYWQQNAVGLAPRTFAVFKNGTWSFQPTGGDILNGTVAPSSNGWYQLELQQEASGTVMGTINGQVVLKGGVGPKAPADGWVALSSSWGYTQFENLTISGPTV